MRYPDDERPSLATTRAIEIDAISNAQVLCVGDVMLDRFVYGGVQRISAHVGTRIRERPLSAIAGDGFTRSNAEPTPT